MTHPILRKCGWPLTSILFLVAVSCSGDDSVTAPVQPDAVIADNVHVLGAGTAVPLDSVLATTYYFSFTGTAPDIQVGDIVVGADSSGFLRSVTSVTTGTSQLVIGTDFASLTDAIIAGSLQLQIPLTLDSSAALAAARVPAPTDTLDLSGIVLYSGDGGIVSITGGYVHFDPDLDIGFKIEDQAVSEFHAVANGELSASMDVHVVATGLSSIAIFGEVASYPIEMRTVYVGSVPVVIGGRLRVCVYGMVDSESLDVNTGFETMMTAKVGSRYEAGVWSTVWEQTSSPGEHETTAGLNQYFSIRMDLSAELVVMVNAMPGPLLSFSPYLLYESNAGAPCHSWELTSGVYGFSPCPMHFLCKEMDDYSYRIEPWVTTLASDTVCAENVIVPLAVGNYWIFDEFTKLGISDSETVSYLGQDYLVYHWNWYNSDGTPSEHYYHVRNGNDGFWLMGSTEWEPMLQPTLVLRYPVTVGESWVFIDNVMHWMECVSTDQTIVAPAGTFTCYVYKEVTGSAGKAGVPPAGRSGPFASEGRRSTTADDKGLAFYLYFAPGVGYVGSGDTPDGSGDPTLLTEYYVQ